MSIMLLAFTAQAAENVKSLDTQACLQVIRDYSSEYETSGKEPAYIFKKLEDQCNSTKELDNLMMNDEYINAVIDRLAETGVLK